MINRTKLEHILEYARQQKCIGQLCKIPPGDMVEIVEMAMRKAGNSPVTPDGWVPVSERMPEPYEYVLVTDGFDGCEVMRVNTDGYWGPAKSLYPGSITHWMPLPAAPQQEVK